MDLVTRGVPPTPDERAAIESVLGMAPIEHGHDARGGHTLRARRHLLLPALHAVNDRVGWISVEAIDHLAERLDVAPAEIYGVATFYDLFATTARPARKIRVCVDVACRRQGEPVLAADEEASPCLGMCEHAPARLVIDAGDPPRRVVLGGGVEHPPVASVPQAGSDELVLLRRAGRGDPLDLDAYIDDGGLAALSRAGELGADGVITTIAAAGLTGRGGAGFPTARKWEAVRDQPATERHVVCNADESEPGTFKDRALIENDPYAVLEALCITMFAVGATTDAVKGWVYLRGEYPRAEATLRAALDRLTEHGVVGDGTPYAITIVRGAGAYICGEETAIFNSIEGYRGEPRNKPPFPFERGLFGKPTVVNNVETLANVPPILTGRARRDRRLFCVSGAVRRPGVYEFELGLTVGELIEHAGGLPDGSTLQGVLLGGAAGRFAGPDVVDVVLDADELRAAGLTLGSGVVMVHDQHSDMVDQVRRIARFFRHESCGQCVPCRVGTVRQEEALDRLVAGTGDAIADLGLLDELGRAMTDASICGLGQTASHAISSAVEVFGLFGDRRSS